MIQGVQIRPGMFIRAAFSPESPTLETDLVFTPHLEFASDRPDFHYHRYVTYKGVNKPIFQVIAKIKPVWESRVKTDLDAAGRGMLELSTAPGDVKFLALGPEGVGIIWLFKDEYVEVLCR